MDRSGESPPRPEASTSNDNNGTEGQELGSLFSTQLPSIDLSPTFLGTDSTPAEEGSYHQKHTFCAKCAKGEHCPLADLGSTIQVEESAAEELANLVPGTFVTEDMEPNREPLFSVGEDVIQRSEALHQVLAKNPPPGNGPWWNEPLTFNPIDSVDGKIRVDSKSATGSPTAGQRVRFEDSLTVQGGPSNTQTSQEYMDNITVIPPAIPSKSRQRASSTSIHSGSPPASLTGSSTLAGPSNQPPAVMYSTTLEFTPLDNDLVNLAQRRQERYRASQHLDEIMQGDPSQWPKRLKSAAGTIDRIRERNRNWNEQDIEAAQVNRNALDGAGQENTQTNEEVLCSRDICIRECIECVDATFLCRIWYASPLCCCLRRLW